MTPIDEIGLVRRCLPLVQSQRPPLEDDEALVPVARYTDPDRYAAELALMCRHPNLVVPSGALPNPGDFVTRDVLGTPTILTRGDDGAVRALVNVCRHRGAQVERKASGSCKRFVCPYHAWTYGRDGALGRPRHADGFPSLRVEQSGLRTLPCFEAAGFVWVTPDLRAPEPTIDAGTAQLFAELEHFGTADAVPFQTTRRTWRAHWKLLVDGGLESYHFRVAHRDTIGPYFADSASVYDTLGPHVRSILPRTSLADLAERPEAQWSLREHTHVLYSVFPNASLLVQEGHVELIQMWPVSLDETEVEITTLVPDPGPDGHSDKARGYWTANHALTNTTLDEDFVLGEQIQRGLSTGANEAFRFARFEGALTAWHGILEARLAERAS